MHGQKGAGVITQPFGCTGFYPWCSDYPDTTTLRLFARVADAMRGDPHVRQVNTDWGERVKRVRVDVDQDKARTLGISSWQIKSALETSLSGMAVTQYREGDQSLDVVGRLVALRCGHRIPSLSPPPRRILSRTSKLSWTMPKVPTTPRISAMR